ncbi:MAG: TIGR02147 family protein [Myxococcales bacterium]|nr:MAG: TIGR02147 family protein [Myxococcales bacterium]
MKRTKLDIFAYTDFRRFLEDRLEELRAEDKKYSRRYFVQKLELASSNYLKRIIDGSRKLSDSLARRVTQEIGLNKEETRFFQQLVRYGQTNDTQSRTEALEDLRRNRRFVDVHQLELNRFDYYADPLMVALREMADLRDFQEDPGWIAARLPFNAGKKRIAEAIARLVASGHLARGEDGRLAAVHKHQDTGEQLGSMTLRTYHLKMLERAMASMELPVEQRHYLGLAMSIPVSAYDAIVEEMKHCRDRVRAIVDAAEETERVYHLEMAFFPLTIDPKKK